MRNIKFAFAVFLMTSITFSWAVQPVSGQDDPNKKILKDAVVGAGVGAVSSSASGGDAGKGALIGAGTNVIGNAVMDVLTAPPQQPQVQYVQTSERGYASSDSSPRNGGCGRSR